MNNSKEIIAVVQVKNKNYTKDGSCFTKVDEEVSFKNQKPDYNTYSENN